MKKISLYALLMLFAVLQTAKASSTVSTGEAGQTGLNFIKSRLMIKDAGSASNLTIRSILPIVTDGQTLMYAVNFNRGFVLVSASRRCWPVPAYAFSGEFNPPDKQANVSAWLRQYEQQIAFAEKYQVEPTEKIRQAWQQFSAPEIQIEKFREVEPLLVSNWDQGKYYNGLCPEDPAGPGGHCYAGCVATAMGQVMYYFRHPQTGTGSYSYYHPDYDTISANFGNTTYRWNEMVNQVSGSNTAVAELLFHLGVSVDMVYGPNGSGMYNHKAAYSLRTYFKYSPETQYVYRDSTSMDWDSLLVTHLNQHIPMYYAGWSVPNINGHAFVVDGYQGENYYHFNWGWSGSYDGYFYTDELTPGGSNFNLAQELIINCFPDTNNYTYPEYCQNFTTLNRLEGTFTDGSGPCYNYQPQNDCEWLISPQNQMDSVTTITLSFQRFDLENENDYLCVYDGPTANDPLIGMLTGNQLPEDIVSSGNQMYLVFHSYDENTAPGFFASYETETPVWCNGMTMHTAPTAEISDGSGGFYYYNNNICMWYIKPDNAAEITMHFDMFDTEPEKDFVKIFDPTTSNLLAEHSGYFDPGNLPPPVTSTSGEMYITFTTNSYVRADGWSGWYTSTSVGLEEEVPTPLFNIFPNPASDQITIQWPDKEHQPVKILIYNAFGKLIKSFHLNWEKDHMTGIDVRKFNQGLYLMNLATKKGAETHKFMINR